MSSRILPALGLSAVLICMGAIAPAHALDVAGYVLDKLGNPLLEAKVCIQAEPTRCVSTDAKGAFKITGTNSIRNAVTGRGSITLEWKHGALSLNAASATPARLQWLTADGRRPLAVQDVNLVSGRNALALPGGLPRAGVILLRLTTPDRSLAYKAVLASGRAAAGGVTGETRIASLSKASAVGMLVVTKTGYKTKLYQPFKETENDVLIFLTADGDNGYLFDGTVVIKVLAIDRTKKAIVTEAYIFECDENGKLVKDTVQDTGYYAIRDGKMYAWGKRECTGQIFTGPGSDPVGTWTLTQAEADLPADLKTGCVPDTVGFGPVPIGGYTAVYSITETSISNTYTADLCPGEIYGLQITEVLMDTTVTVTKNTCKQVVYKNGKGESATVDFTKRQDSIHIAFTYKTTVCEASVNNFLGDDEPDCDDEGGLDALVGCMYFSGFVEIVGEKKSAGSAGSKRISLERSAVRKRLPMSFEPIRIPSAGGKSRGLSIFPGHGAR